MTRGQGRRGLVATVAAMLLLLCGAGPALAEGQRPAVDPTAPTPSEPYAGLPPQGSAPDGSTVGGAALGTRGTVVVDGAPPLPEGIAARGWLVADAHSGAVLAARDPHGRYYPASTLKALMLQSGNDAAHALARAAGGADRTRPR